MPIIVTVFSILADGVMVFAAEDGVDGDVKALYRLRDHMSQQGLFSFVGREIGWAIAIGLRWICKNCESLMNKAYKLVNWTTDASVSQWIDVSMPIVGALMGCGFVFFGLCKMTKKDFAPPIVQNVVLFVCIIMASTTFFHMGNKLIKAGKDYMSGDVSITDTIIASNVEDIYTFQVYGYKYGKKKGKKAGGANEDKKGITPKNNPSIIDNISPAEDIDGDSDENPYITDSNKKGGENASNEMHNVYDYELVISPGKKEETNCKSAYTKKIGEKMYTIDAEEIGDGLIPLLNDHYYRYNFNFFNMYVGLIALIFVYLFTSYKVARISFELLIHKIIAPFVSAADITNGKRIRQVLMSIVGNYLTLLAILLIQQTYAFAFVYISEKGWNIFSTCFIQLFLAIAVVDAPNIFEQILGVDAGLKSAFSMFGVARATSTIMHGAGKVVSTVTKASGGVAKGATNIAGAASGFGASVFDASPSGQASGISTGGSETTSGNLTQNNQSSNVQDVVASKSENNNSANPINAPKEAMVNSGIGFDHPNNYYIDPNTLGQRYRGSIGDFMKKNSSTGQRFSQAQSFGNALGNSLVKQSAGRTIQGKDGKDGATGAKGAKGDRGERGFKGTQGDANKPVRPSDM